MEHSLTEGLPSGPVAALTPFSESRRLEALRSYTVLDSEPEQVFDDLKKVAAVLCEAPIALVSLVDAQRQWFKARVGLEATETPRELAFAPTHRSASQFATVAKDASVTGDLKPALAALAKVNQTCVACHAGYRLH